MENVNTWEKLASALKEDPALEEKLRQTVDRMIQESGETADARLVARAAESLGFSLSQGELPGGAVPMIDDTLTAVAGGKCMQGEDNISGFDFNTWLGGLLRDLLQRDSARVMEPQALPAEDPRSAPAAAGKSRLSRL